MLVIILFSLIETEIACSVEANNTCDPTAACIVLSNGSFKCVCPTSAVGGDGLKGENHTGCTFGKWQKRIRKYKMVK